MSGIDDYYAKEAKIKENIVLLADKIIAWCDEQVKDGSVLTIEWDGGNDSGSFYLKVNDADINTNWGDPEDIPNLILEKADEILEYGSFAGDYNTQGTLTYDPETKTFTGVDNYSESEVNTLGSDLGDPEDKVEIKIKVPKDLWFDKAHINCVINDSLSEFEEFTAQLQVLQGPLTASHTQWAKSLQHSLFKQIQEVMKGVDDDLEYSQNEWVIDRGDFVEEGNFLVYTITEFTYSYYVTTSKDIEVRFKDDEDEED